MKYCKQSPFYLLASIVKQLENPITLCISRFRLSEPVRDLLSLLFDSHRAPLKTRMKSLELFFST